MIFVTKSLKLNQEKKILKVRTLDNESKFKNLFVDSK